MVIANRDWVKRAGTGKDCWELERVLADEYGINPQYIYRHERAGNNIKLVAITTWPDWASLNEWHAVGKRPFVPHSDTCRERQYELVQQIKYAGLLAILDWVRSEVDEE